MHEGIVQNGVVVFEPGFTLPEGTKVHVQPVQQRPADDVSSPAAALLKFVGIADDLPVDMADNHDHYLHGAPKK